MTVESLRNSIRGATAELEGLGSAATSVAPGLSTTNSELRGIQEGATQTMSALESVSTSLAQGEGQVQRAKDNIAGLISVVEQDVPKTVRRLGSLIKTLEQEAKAGNLQAEALIQIIAGVEAGFVDANLVIDQFDGQLVAFEGRLQRTDGLLNALLPKVGQVQSDIRAFVKDVKGETNAFQILTDQLLRDGIAASEAIANIAQGVAAGSETIDELVRALSALKTQGFGGSSASILGEELLQQLIEAQRMGAL